MPSRSIYSSHSECIPAAPKAHSPTFCRAKLSASRKLCVVIPYSFHYTLSTAETTSSRHRKHLGDRATLGKGIGINFTRHNIRECPRQRGEIVEISAGAIIQTKMLCLLGPHQTRKDTKYRIEAETLHVDQQRTDRTIANKDPDPVLHALDRFSA